MAEITFNPPNARSSVTYTETRVWNGPVCHQCGQGYLDTHDCDLIPIPCPDNREECAVRHLGHRPRPDAGNVSEAANNAPSGEGGESAES